MAKRRGFPPIYKIERVAKMSVKRAFFSVFQKLVVFCCAMFFCFANAFSANLPSGYTELEYIESTGTQYIDTGIYGGAGLSVDMVVHGTGDRGVIFSFDQDYTGSFVGDNGTDFVGPGIFTGISSLVKTNITTYWESENSKLKQTTTINGVTKTSNMYSRTPSVITLFKGSNWSENNSFWAGKIFSFLLKRNGVAIRNFVPAKNSSGVVGMYDTVSGTFFTNAGTGEFIAGPVVLDSCRNLFDKTTVTANRYITPSGSITSDGTNRTVVSGEIYVKSSTTYTLSGVGNIYGASYNRSGFQYQADGTPISAITATRDTGIVTFTTDANCAYVRVMSVTANVDTAMLEEGSTATDYVPYCATPIKIATTAYNAARFSPVVNDLNTTIATIREIVTKTINQTAAIASLQADKQTRPEDACPAGKKCLLVETEENGVVVPHWFPIIEAPE